MNINAEKLINQLVLDFKNISNYSSSSYSPNRKKIEYILELVPAGELAPYLFPTIKDHNKDSSFFEQLLILLKNRNYKDEDLTACINSCIDISLLANYQPQMGKIISKFFLMHPFPERAIGSEDKRKIEDFINFYDMIGQKAQFNWIEDLFLHHFDYIYKFNNILIKNPIFSKRIEEFEATLSLDNSIREKINLFFLADYEVWMGESPKVNIVKINESEIDSVLKNGFLNRAYDRFNFDLELRHIELFLSFEKKDFSLQEATISKIIERLVQLENGHTMVGLILTLPGTTYLTNHGEWIRACIDKIKLGEVIPSTKSIGKAKIKL